MNMYVIYSTKLFNQSNETDTVYMHTKVDPKHLKIIGKLTTLAGFMKLKFLSLVLHNNSGKGQTLDSSGG